VLSGSLLNFLKQNSLLNIICLATIAVYDNSLVFPHISWDDPEMVFKNVDVKHFRFFQFFTKQYVGNYIPLTMVFHAVTWVVFNEQVWGHHLLNLLFHVANGILVYVITYKIFTKKELALLTATVFLLHPVQIESVNWIAELKNVSYGFFFLLAIYHYITFLNKKRSKHIWMVSLFFVLACLSKPSAIVLPLTLICIDLLMKQKWETKTLLNKIPLFFIALLFGIINLKTQSAAQFINYAHQFPLPQKIINSGFALFSYFKLFLFPVNLSVLYAFPENSVFKTIVGISLWLLILFFLFIFYRKKNYTLVAVLGFILINFILVLQFIPFGEVLYADRYMYIPLIGLAWLLVYLLDKIPMQKLYLSIVLLIGLSLMSFQRSQKWNSSITLYEDVLKKYPNNFLALNSLGVECMMKNNNDKALLYFNRAIESAPQNYKSYYNRALLYLKNNQPKAAIKDLNKTLEMYDYYKAYIARAAAYYALLDYKNARSDAKTALFKDKKNHKAWFILGNCDNDENSLDNALALYNRAIELNKEEADYYFKRAIALGKKQLFSECMADLNMCLNLNPKYTEAYYWRGVAKANVKENPCEDFNRAAEGGYAPAKDALQKHCIK